MPVDSRKQIENGMRLMTARKRAKAVSSPQFPFLFPLDAFGRGMKTRALRPPIQLGLSHWLGVRGRRKRVRALKNSSGSFAASIAAPSPREKNVRSFNDLTGRKFGFLRVLEYAGTDRHRRR